MHHSHFDFGLLFGVIASIFIIHIFGLYVFFWCIPAIVVLIVLIMFYNVFVKESWVPDLGVKIKILWHKYERWELGFIRRVENFFKIRWK